MNINTMIANLTEKEAKAALEYLITFIAGGNRILAVRDGDIEKGKYDVLEMALEEARK